MTDLHVVILAAGASTRMKSTRAKVLHAAAGRSLIEHVLETAGALGAASTTIVVGPASDEIRSALAHRPDVQFAVQSPPRGTGHALLQAEPALAGKTGSVLLLYADVPLLTPETLRGLVAAHVASSAAETLLTATFADPSGYGRIVRGSDGAMQRIVEDRDASPDERSIREINSGIGVFALAGLLDALRGLSANNAQGEYYLTDLVARFREQGRAVATVTVPDANEVRGVNTRVELAEVTAILRARKNRALMLSGVSLDDPATTYVDMDVRVGGDSRLGAGVHLEGRTSIGARCQIHAGVRITDGTIADDVIVFDHSVIVESTVGAGARVGPMAHLRPKTHIGPDAHVGNFVEFKKTSLGRGSKANHVGYLGDATIGDGVNIGAGTIICNYDGVKKHQTVIEDEAFIGSDSQLIAPVRIGRGAYVAAGSSISKDVPADALGIARAQQINKADWARKRRKGTP